MKRTLPNEWRTTSKWQLWFYARYMRWLERLGYVLLVGVVAAMGYAFTYQVDEVISADVVEVLLDESTGAVYLEASLKGETAPAAKVGQTVRLTGITMEPVAGTLLRASDGQSEWISGTLLTDSVKQSIEDGLAGQTLKTRFDSSLTVESVEDVAVDARIKVSTGEGTTEDLEPSANVVVMGKVVSGDHLATVQLSTLPPDVRARAEEAVRAALVGQSVNPIGGAPSKASELESVHFVVKVKAVPEADGSAGLGAAPISREFRARIEISNPPRYLVSALKAGRAVTCRVELATGQKPIALTLLKKS
jgi:hypothetical protein